MVEDLAVVAVDEVGHVAEVAGLLEDPLDEPVRLGQTASPVLRKAARVL